MNRLPHIAVVLAVAFAVVVGAHGSTFPTRQLQDTRVGTSHAELVAQRGFSANVVHRLAGSWMVAPRHATCWSHVPWTRTCDRFRRLLIRHRALYRLAVSQLGRLYPSVGHLTGWMCIHGGEGNGWDRSHTYSGPLQMTSGWEGYGVSDWNTLPILTVYAAAEKVAAARGFDSSWMRGQWPNTYPPCAGLF